MSRDAILLSSLTDPHNPDDNPIQSKLIHVFNRHYLSLIYLKHFGDQPSILSRPLHDSVVVAVVEISAPVQSYIIVT